MSLKKILYYCCCYLVNVTMCEPDILTAVANAHIPSGTITLIENRDHRRWTLHQPNRTQYEIRELEREERWLFHVYDSKTDRISPAAQRKQYPHQAIIIFLSDVSAIYHVIDLVRSLRIVGSGTKMIITGWGISEGVMKKLLNFVWDSLKIFNVCFVDSGEIYRMIGDDLVVRSVESVFKEELMVRELDMRALWFEDGIYVYFGKSEFDGVCIQIVQAIAEALNITVKIDFLLSFENMYRPFGPDGEFGGFLGVLHRQEADIVCGSISLFETRHHASDALPSFTQEALMWIVATNGPIRGWKRLIYEFSKTMWAVVGITWCVSILVLYAHHRMQGKKDFTKIAVHIVGATLEISFIKHLGGFRGFLWLFLVYSMIITSAYKSGLTSLLTLPVMEEKISTVEEGLQAGRLVFILPSWEDIIESWTDADDVTTLWDVDFRGRYEIMSSSLESLLRMANNQSVMTLMPEDEADSLIFKYFLDVDGLKAFYYLPERFMNYPKVICMAPGHPLYERFAVKQMQVVEAGLIDFWFRLLFHRQLVHEINGSRSAIFETGESVPLGMGHLSGLFWALLFGMFVSFFVFLGEKFVKYWYK